MRGETEERDDRAQVEDNFYLRERLAEAKRRPAGRRSARAFFIVSATAPSIEFVCLDTSKEDFFRGRRLFEYPKHWEFLEAAFPADRGRAVADPVLSPSAVLRGPTAPQHEEHAAARPAVPAHGRNACSPATSTTFSTPTPTGSITSSRAPPEAAPIAPDGSRRRTR